MWSLKISVQGRMKVMVNVGKMWGRSYVAGSGKLSGRFLGSWASTVRRRTCSVLTRSSQELHSPPRPDQLQGSPGQDPAERAAWGGRREMTIAAGCEYQEEELWSKMAQGHPVWGGVNPEEGGRSCSRDFASSSSGTKSSHAGRAKLFFLYYSKLITCKPHDSLTVPALLLQQLAAKSTQGCEYGFLCHLLKGNLPAVSLWLPRDRLLGVQGGAVWAKPAGPHLGTIPGTGRWSFWRH